MYRSLVEACQGLIWRCDTAGRYTFLNEAWEHTFGYRREEMLGRHFQEFQSAEVSARDSGAFARRIAAGSVASYETTQLAKDGREINLLVSAVPLHSADGRLVGIQGTALDITERKRAELKLEESEHLLRLHEEQTFLAQELGSAGSWVYDLATDSIWGSAGGFRIFGYPPVAGDFPIENIESRIVERERVHQALVDLITGGKEYRLEYTVRPADGAAPREVFSTARLKRDAEGKPVRVIGFVQDISERKHAERERARLFAEAVEARRLRDEVLGIVSHDLRNPLNSIALQAAVLARRPADEHAIAGIQRAVARATRLVEDLLLATSVDAGMLTLDRRHEPIGPIVEEVTSLHAALAEAKAVEFETAVEDGVTEAFVDRHRLVQLLSNLVANAIAFTPRGGRVSLRARSSDGCVVFTVSDTGPGIEPAQMGHLFDRFWQGAHAHRAGAGLGLSIAKGIADAHGAPLRVDSELGHGATFTLSLPKAGEHRPGLDGT